MAINLSDNILAQTTKPGDAKYGPYYGSGATAAAALTDAKNNSVFLVLINNFRYKGLTVGIVLTIGSTVQPIKEYWFEDGITDIDLVEKSSGGTVGGTGTVNAIPYWSAIDTLSDSAASHFNAKRVDVKSNLHLLGEGTPGNAPGYLRFESGDKVNHVGFFGPGNGLDTDSYDLFLPTTLPSVTNQILESNASGSLSWIPTPTGGTGTVTGSGTPNTLTKWSTGGIGIEDSEISDSGTVVKIGNNSSNLETLYINTDTRSVGFRTPAPTASAFDVNGTMRVRNELNVGATTEQSLFVQGPGTGSALPAYYVKMGSYGQGLITGSPAVAEQGGQNLRRSAAFGNKGKVVDNYIYDTFEVSPAILEGLGTTPLAGQVLVNTPSDQVCVLADFWFYRQIKNNSAIGNWGDNTELVIYPSNDLSGQTVASPYEQGYFRVTYDFLSTAATGGSSGSSCGFYQGNINGVDQGGMNGAWQIGDNTNNQPLGNKVYLSLSTGSSSPPTFSAATQTKFYIGLKYRFLSIEHGIVNNDDLIVLEQQKRKFVQCEPVTDECQEFMPGDMVLYSSLPAGTVVKIQLDSVPEVQCCYTVVILSSDVSITPGYTLLSGNFDNCELCVGSAAEAKMYFEQCTGQTCEAMPSKFTKTTTLNRGDVVQATDGATTCCYTVTDLSTDIETRGIVVDRAVSASCDACIKSSGPTVDEYRKCSNVPTGDKSSCDPANTADIVFITYNSNNPVGAVLVNSRNGARCCYTKVSNGSGPVTTPAYSVDVSIKGCDDGPDECQQ